MNASQSYAGCFFRLQQLENLTALLISEPDRIFKRVTRTLCLRVKRSLRRAKPQPQTATIACPDCGETYRQRIEPKLGSNSSRASSDTRLPIVTTRNRFRPFRRHKSIENRRSRQPQPSQHGSLRHFEEHRPNRNIETDHPVGNLCKLAHPAIAGRRNICE